MKKKSVAHLLLAVFFVTASLGNTACAFAKAPSAKPDPSQSASAGSTASAPATAAASTSASAPAAAAASTSASAPTAKPQKEAPLQDLDKIPGEFLAQEGKLLSCTKEDGHYSVAFSDADGGMVYHLKDDVLVLDQKTGKFQTPADLKQGMNVLALLPKHSPTTMSLPPQTSGAVLFVIKSEAGAANVSVYDQNLTNAENTLALHIADTTQILSLQDTKKRFTGEDIKGSEALVLYHTATRSIPAQTTPEMVLLLSAPGAGASTEKTGSKDPSSKEAPSYAELRSAAEAKGYTIQWTSKTQPILLTKDDMQIHITLGHQDFTFTHQTADLKELDTMKKLDLPPVLQNGRTMVPKSFLDALE